MFWWGIVRLSLMPIGEHTNLDNQRVVLVASMIEGLKINFGHITTDEMFVRAHQITSSLSFYS